MMESSEERRKLVHDFLSFTGTSDEGKALSFLDTANWKLPDAVQLYYAEQTAEEPTDIGASTSAAEEEVRAPLPSKIERLVDRSAQYEHLLQRKTKQTPIYEAFRNHSAELAEYEHGPDAEGGTKGLAKLYKAPIEILFRGSFEDAKEAALNKSIWLMVNVQSANEFASHQLNCDTFSNPALKEMIKVNFIFIQTYNNGNTGQKLMAYYRLEKFPCILIIDPVTGELMRCFSGFVEASRLIEDLVEYMDCSPTDGAASRLMKRQQRHKPESIDANNPDTSTEDSPRRKPEDVEETSDVSDESQQEEKPVRESPKPHATNTAADGVRAQPATSAIPPESGEDTCTVGILLPDGGRLQRRFYKHDTIESLYGFCCLEYQEARTKPYKLKPRMPGSSFLEDFTLTLESAQVNDSLLALVWET